MPKAYRRCVEELAKIVTIRNPHAVCTARNAGGIKEYRKKEAKAAKR